MAGDVVVHEYGDPGAPPMVLLHGLTEAGTTWPDAVEHWGRALADVGCRPPRSRRLAALHRRGAGGHGRGGAGRRAARAGRGTPPGGAGRPLLRRPVRAARRARPTGPGARPGARGPGQADRPPTPSAGVLRAPGQVPRRDARSRAGDPPDPGGDDVERGRDPCLGGVQATGRPPADPPPGARAGPLARPHRQRRRPDPARRAARRGRRRADGQHRGDDRADPRRRSLHPPRRPRGVLRVVDPFLANLEPRAGPRRFVCGTAEQKSHGPQTNRGGGRRLGLRTR